MSLHDEIDAYIENHWEEICSDLDSLVSIESVRDDKDVQSGAPFGPGPKAALDQMLALGAGYGFAVDSCDGYMGMVDLPGTNQSQIGVIGHVDVVPAGPGWTFPAFSLTRKDGYLIGRGVLDDKGPLLIALHAMRFWKLRNEQLRHSIRLLVGTCEETTMEDVDYYLEHHEEPTFLFSPDGQFPVVYGEGGIAHGEVTSAPIENRHIIWLKGGQATNAVPAFASALVDADLEEGEFGAITVSRPGDKYVLVESKGVSAHASQPWEGDNAIEHLFDFLLSNGIGADEREFLELGQTICHNIDGSTLAIDCSDEHFGDLTVVPSVLDYNDEQKTLSLKLDFRYPTTTSRELIEKRVNNMAAAYNCTFEITHDAKPFVMNPDSKQVRALLDAYCEVTGKAAAATTSKGGTYARLFRHGVCFGPDGGDDATPDWIGSLHGPNEGVSERSLKDALRIYALALGNLMQGEL